MPFAHLEKMLFEKKGDKAKNVKTEIENPLLMNETVDPAQSLRDS